jgi:flagellar hook-length control protein FliK
MFAINAIPTSERSARRNAICIERFMNATGSPIQVPSAPQGNTDLAPPTATSASDAPTDFVLALAQMLGTSVPATNVEGQVAALPSTRKRDAELDMSDALALLSLPMQPAQAQVAQQPSNELDPLEMLGLTTRGDNSARNAAILQALTERLAAADESPQDVQLPSGAVQAAADAAQLRATQTASTARALHSPVGSQAWANELGTQVTMMTHKGEHTASLRLSPENLGPLEIRIAMREDQASVWFGAAHADTRAAIEHALPRLREMFAAQGMSLADAGVFREPPKQHPSEWRGGSGNNDPANGTEPVSSAVSVQVGLLDAYA